MFIDGEYQHSGLCSFEALMPLLSFIGPAVSAVSGIESLFGGGGKSSAPSAPATTTPATTPTTPSISAGDYTNQQNQYYQQMLAGLGMGTEGNQLPQGLQDAISKQAALL